jgi:hypothetical protein
MENSMNPITAILAAALILAPTLAIAGAADRSVSERKAAGEAQVQKAGDERMHSSGTGGSGATGERKAGGGMEVRKSGDEKMQGGGSGHVSKTESFSWGKKRRTQ